MRLRRLDLTRYGRFTDRSLDFGARTEGADLHIVYGPNEAGKSTVLNAILDLLYGIPAQSAYAFIHSYQTMRIGAVLEVGDAQQEVVRIKRPSNSLLDSANGPLPESVMSSALGGIGRDAYRSMFSLDDESLESGGKAILESKGELGEILFSATAGLAGLSRRLGEVKGQADAFYRYRAQGGQLVELKRRLAELQEARERLDMGAARYASLILSRDESRRRYDAILQERASVQTRVEAIVVALGALPRLAALCDQRALLEPLAGLPEPPEAWADALPRLKEKRLALAVEAGTVEEEIERLASSLDRLMPDEAALRAEHRLASLAALHPRKETALQDLPIRIPQLVEEDAAIAGILSRIGGQPHDTPSAFILPAAVTAALQEAIEAWSGVETAVAVARAALRDAEERRDEAARKLQDAGAHPVQDEASRRTSLDELAAVVAAGRLSDHRVRARSAQRCLREGESSLRAGLSALQPFSGTPETLAALRVPEAKTLAAWNEAAQRHDAELRRLADEERRLDDEIAGLAAERDGLADGGMLADEAAAAARAERDRTWSEHRTALDAGSADRFAAAMARDDATGVRQLLEASVRAQLRRIDVSLSGARARREAIDAAIGRTQTGRDALRAEITRTWRIMACVEEHAAPTITEFESWVSRREAVLKVATACEEARRSLDEATDDGARLVDRLQKALGRIGAERDTDDLDVLLQRAQAIIDATTAAQAHRAALRDREADWAKRRLAQDAAERAARDWARDWTAACSSCWIGTAHAMPGVALVREVLKELGVLAPAWERRVALADRIDKMERDVASYAAEARAIAALIEEHAAGIADAELAGRVIARVAGAIATRDRRGALIEARDGRQQRYDTLAREIATVALRLAEMAGFFGVDGVDAVADRLAQVASRRQLRDAVATTEREIVEALGSASMEAAEALLRAADRGALELERSEARLRLNDLDGRCHAMFAAWSAAADAVEAVGGDARAAKLEEQRRTTLLEIEDGARRYLKVRAGVAALEQALRLYRDRHRGAMMERASETFSTISGGAYSGLRTQPHKDREVLIAVAADGSSKDANDLSKGTRFQLYLALRAAGYLEGAWSGAPPPFVADDIMETFDDTRAEEALRLFTRMTDVGQVIYLTHHRHLLPIARVVCPNVRIHRLG